MHNESTKALYEFYKLEDKNDFFPAYLYLKYIQHFICYVVKSLGIPTKELAIDWNTVIFNMITIKGIYGREMYETWYLMQSMIQTGLDISPIITHKFHYTEFEEAFEIMRSGNSGKVIMDWIDE